MNRKTKTIIIISSVIGLIAAIGPTRIYAILFITGGISYGFVDELIYHDQAEFSSASWKEGDLKTRYSYIDVLIADGSLSNKNGSEIIQILGEPDRVEKGPKLLWHYETKKPGWTLICLVEGGGLSIEFNKENKVINALDSRWVD